MPDDWHPRGDKFSSSAQRRMWFARDPDAAERVAHKQKRSNKGRTVHLPGHVDKADTTNVRLPRKVHGRGRPSSRYGGTPGHGRRTEEPTEFGKALGSWKTIDQREQHQRRDKKVRRGALAAAGSGAGVAGYSIHHAGLQGRNAVEDAHDIIHPMRGSALSRMSVPMRLASRGHGTGVLAGAGMVAGGLGVAGAATGMKGYHQRRINQRRRANHGRGTRQVTKAFTPTPVLARTKPIAQLAADGGADLSPATNAAQAVNAPKIKTQGAAGKTPPLAGRLTSMAQAKPMTGQSGTMTSGGLASMGSQKPQQAMGGMGSIGSMSKAEPARSNVPVLVRTQRRSHDPERGRQFRLGAATAGTAAGGGSMLLRGGKELRRLNREHRNVLGGLEHTKLINLKGGGGVGVGIAGLVGASQLARYSAGNKNRRWT